VSEIKRRKGESFDSFIRRVKQRWLQSGKILQARKVQFFEEKKSKNVRHDQKVDKIQRVAKREYLRKVGRLPAEELEPTFKKRKR
jgi:ribosomal protein S21